MNLKKPVLSVVTMSNLKLPQPRSGGMAQANVYNQMNSRVTNPENGVDNGN